MSQIYISFYTGQPTRLPNITRLPFALVLSLGIMPL